MKRDIRNRIAKAIRSGSVGFAVPEAARYMPTMEQLRKPPAEVTADGFGYIKVSISKQRAVVFQWGYAGIGFGVVTFYRGTDKEWKVDSEEMGPKFVSRMLEAWVHRMMKDQK